MAMAMGAKFFSTNLAMAVHFHHHALSLCQFNFYLRGAFRVVLGELFGQF